MILHALQPFADHPPDRVTTLQRLRDLSDANPGDAEIAFIWGAVDTEGRLDSDSEGLTRALAIDPKMAAVEWKRASGAAARSHTDDAIAHYEKCLRLSPRSATCFRQAANQYALKGECEGFARNARRSVEVEPEDYWSQLVLLAVFLRQGADREQLLGVVDHATQTPYVRAHDVADVADLKGALASAVSSWFGRFDDARADVQPIARFAERGNVYERLEMLEEIDDTAATRALVRAYLNARPLIALRVNSGEPWREVPDAVVLRAIRKHKMANEDRLGELRDAWAAESHVDTEHYDTRTADENWLEYFVEPALTAADARTALTHRPGAGPFELRSSQPRNWERLGRLYLLLGEPATAAPWLERAANTCRVIDGNSRQSYVVSTIRASHELGLAREAMHDVPGACSSYSKVIERWGDAKPRSVTAEASRARMKAIGCNQ